MMMMPAAPLSHLWGVVSDEKCTLPTISRPSQRHHHLHHNQVCVGPCVEKEGKMNCPFVKWQWDEVITFILILIKIMIMAITIVL